jgi:5-hydroxyisourate hydrolase
LERERISISTHVLDTSLGRPAAGVAVRLLRQEGPSWIEMFSGETNGDGRVPALRDVPGGAGAWRLTFDAGGYFQRQQVESFYTVVTIEFVVRPADAHYHVPLLVSPFGYSTYRGS